MAARTNANLRKGLEPVARRYFADIVRLARELLPDAAAALGEGFDALVGTVVAAFDGESLHRFVAREPDFEERRLELLVAAVGLFAQKRRA
jgi:hypothetical protein